jgi:hypothetical protein
MAPLDRAVRARDGATGSRPGWASRTPGNHPGQEGLRADRQLIGPVAPVAVAEAASERANGVVRQTVMSIPGRIFRGMAGFSDYKVRR